MDVSRQVDTADRRRAGGRTDASVGSLRTRRMGYKWRTNEIARRCSGVLKSDINERENGIYSGHQIVAPWNFVKF